MAKNLYCKLYICCDFSIEELFDTINGNLNGETSGFFTISTGVLELDLRKNSEFDSTKAISEDDFLFRRYYADIEARKVKESIFISSIKSLTTYLLELGIQIVASCDFEDELKL